MFFNQLLQNIGISGSDGLKGGKYDVDDILRKYNTGSDSDSGSSRPKSATSGPNSQSTGQKTSNSSSGGGSFSSAAGSTQQRQPPPRPPPTRTRSQEIDDDLTALKKKMGLDK